MQTRLIHIYARATVVIYHRVAEVGVLLAPELLRHTHWRNSVARELVVGVGMCRAVGLAGHILLDVLLLPRLARLAPLNRVHVRSHIYTLRLRLGNGLYETLTTFAWWEVLWKCIVVWTVVPPVPQYAHIVVAEVLLQIGSLDKHIR